MMSYTMYAFVIVMRVKDGPCMVMCMWRYVNSIPLLTLLKKANNGIDFLYIFFVNVICFDLYRSLGFGIISLTSV